MIDPEKQDVYCEAFKSAGLPEVVALSLMENVSGYLNGIGNFDRFDTVMLKLLDFCHGILKPREIGHLLEFMPMKYEFTSRLSDSEFTGPEIVIKINNFLSDELKSKI